jgi:hypothetical protein
MRSSENQEKIAYPTLPEVSTNARNGVDSPAPVAVLHELSLEVRSDLGKLIEGGFEVLGYFEGDDAWIGEIGGVLQAVVLQPENVEIDFVALQ